MTEIDIIINMQHCPYIVRLFEIIVDKSQVYIVLEHAPHGSLQAYLRIKPDPLTEA